MKKKCWLLVFEINGGEYQSDLIIEATKLSFSYEKNFVKADEVLIKFDENLIKVSEITEV